LPHGAEEAAINERVELWAAAVAEGTAGRICDRLVEHHHRQYGIPPRLVEALATTPTYELSERERDVLTLVARGMTLAETASRLFLGVETIRTHRKKALRKLKAKNMPHAVALAISRGVIQGFEVPDATVTTSASERR